MKGICIALEGDKEVAWIYTDEDGKPVAYDIDGALLVVSEINREEEVSPSTEVQP